LLFRFGLPDFSSVFEVVQLEAGIKYGALEIEFHLFAYRWGVVVLHKL